MDTPTTNYISLYSGGGGLDLGFQLAVPDARPVCYVERDAEACALLVDHMEAELIHPAPLWTDSSTFDGKPWRGKVDWIIGGPPCQPFSVAGKRRAADDPRNLWPITLRVVGIVQPQGCFFENVPSADSLWYIYETVVPGLRYLGYEVEVGIFSASEVGASHLRERIFILAYSNSVAARIRPRQNQKGPLTQCVRDELAQPERPRRTQAGQRRDQHAGSEPETGRGELGDAGHDAGGAELGQQREDAASRARGPSEGVGDANGTGLQVGVRPGSDSQAPRTPSRPNAFPPGPGDTDAWAAVLKERPDLAPAVKSEVRVLADGLAGRVDGLPRVARLRILGNGVVPAQAARAFHELTRRLMT